MLATPPLPADVLPSAADLADLLAHLYPEPPLVDILTLADFQFRYRFSGLGAGAVAAIERAQRITRAIGDYDQMGLSEFHNGLIYLHEGQFLGALPYFAEARRYWDFANRGTAVCLAYFAQGVARHGAFQFERALGQYGKVEKCMAQFPVDDVATETGPFWQALRQRLAACRLLLLQQMRNIDEGQGPEDQARRLTLASEPPPPPPPPDENGAQTTLLEEPGQRPSPPPIIQPTDRRPPADMPIVNLPGAAPAGTAPAGAEQKTEPQTPAADVTGAPTPIPAHRLNRDHLVWMKPDPASWPEVRAFLPDMRADAHILVDRRIEQYVFRHNDLVIVDDEAGSGIVPVQPEQPPLATRYPAPIYLGKIQEPPDHAAFTGAATPQGTVKLSPDSERPLYAEHIIGIVVGIWFGLDVQQRPSGGS